MPHRAPGASGHAPKDYLKGKPVKYYRPCGSAEVRHLIEGRLQIAFPLFCEYAIGSSNGRRTRRALVHNRDQRVADLLEQARAAGESKAIDNEPAGIDRYR
jgi:hypothetical protein